MNAVSFLISRKSSNPSVALAGATLLAWANFRAFIWLDESYRQPLGEFSWILGLVCGLTTFALAGLFVGVFIGAPLHHLSQMHGTIRRFAENRILDELTSTGLTARMIVNQVFFYYLKRLAILILPSACAWWFISGEVEFLALLLAAMAVIISTFSAVLCLTCWKVSAGRRGRLIMVVPSLLLFGPVFAFMEICGKSILSFSTALLYVFVVGYLLSVRGIQSRGRLQNLTSTFRRLTRLRQSRRTFSDNAIVARQEAVGREWGDLLSLSVSAFLLLLAMIVSAEMKAAWPLMNVLLLCGFGASWRAASKLSQSLTTELEGSTLEILRTTPLGARRFMDGWMDLTLKPLLGELCVLSVTCFGFIAFWFPAALSNGSFALCFIATMAMPYLGALFGASIAGQLKTRSELAGQLALVLLLCGFFSVPQVGMLVSLEEPVWLAAVLSLVMAWAAGWVLKAGATKSLNRVFLPQK